MVHTQGETFEPSKRTDEQVDWPAHAAFMDGVRAENFVLLGGPLEGTPNILLIVRAENPDQVRSRLSADCWAESDLLQVASVVPCTPRLGSVC